VGMRGGRDGRCCAVDFRRPVDFRRGGRDGLYLRARVARTGAAAPASVPTSSLFRDSKKLQQSTTYT
jgi:hypothetical protein